MDISKLISKIFALLPMYEERKQNGDSISYKIMEIVGEIDSLSYYYGQDEKRKRKIDSCSQTMIALCSTDFYDLSHKILRKSILDVTGDLNRVKEEVEL